MNIDAKNISKPEHFAEFLDNKSGDILISVGGRATVTTTKHNFLNELLSLMIEDVEVVKCTCEDNTLELTGYDINWWKQSARRYNKLYRAIAENKPVQTERTYKVGVATLKEGQLSQIVTYEGKKEDVIRFMNDEIRTRYVDDFLKMNVVLDLAYREGDENDVTQWYSLTELEEMGAIKL